jgi:hypothetical protein
VFSTSTATFTLRTYARLSASIVGVSSVSAGLHVAPAFVVTVAADSTLDVEIRTGTRLGIVEPTDGVLLSDGRLGGVLLFNGRTGGTLVYEGWAVGELVIAGRSGGVLLDDGRREGVKIS